MHSIQTEKQIRLYLTLPTDRYLKKFIGTKINVEPEYVLSKSDKFGTHLFELLDKDKYEIEFSRTRYNDKIKIIIPSMYQNLGKYEFKKDAVASCNSYMKYWFYESFFEHMNLCCFFSLRMDKAIQSFCKMKNIELDIDIQYETLKKRYHRWREDNGQPLHKYLIELVNEP